MMMMVAAGSSNLLRRGLLQGREGLLRGGQVTGLKRLPQRLEIRG